MTPIRPTCYVCFDCGDGASAQPAGEVTRMLQKYVDAAMQRIVCEYLGEDGLYFCHAPELQGAWAAAASIEQSRAELAEDLEEWVRLGLSHGDHIPVLAGININTAHTR